MDVKDENSLYLNNLEKNRKRFSFKFVRFINYIIFRKPKFKFIKEEFPSEPILLLSNHVGKKAIAKIELYYPREFRAWGAHEMVEGIKSAHHYLCETYYHQKKHFPKWFAYSLGTILTPGVNAFYRGLRLIPTYQDTRFMSTLKWTIREYNSGRDIVIYPEDSSQGYKEELTKFYSGFVYFLEMMYRKGKDVPIFVTYYQKKMNTFVVSEKIMFSELKSKYDNNDDIADAMRIKMNELKDK